MIRLAILGIIAFLKVLGLGDPMPGFIVLCRGWLWRKMRSGKIYLTDCVNRSVISV